MARVTKLNVQITASSGGLSAGIAKANSALDKLTKHAMMARGALGRAFGKVDFSAVGAAATGMASKVGGAMKSIGIATSAAAVGLGYFVKTQIDAIGDSADAAKKLGVEYNALKSIQFAAKLAGIEAETLNSAFEKMSDVVGSALGGNKSSIDALAKLGLTMESISAMQPEQRFEAIGEAIGKIEDPAARISAARDIFGKSGGALVVLFENGGAAIAAATEKLENLGVLLSDIDMSKVEAAGDSLDIIAKAFEGIGAQLAVAVSPVISALVSDTEKWVAAMGGIGPIVDGVLAKLNEKLSSITARMEVLADGAGVIWDIAKKAAPIVAGAIPGGKVAGRVAGGIVADNERYIAGRSEPKGKYHGKPGRRKATVGQRISAYVAGAQSDGEEAARRADQDAANASAVEAAKQARMDEQRASYERMMQQQQADQARAAQIIQGAQQRGLMPSQPLNQPGPWAEVVGALRNIERNTGKNAIGFAG